ncbi:MAG: MFS transporter [Acidimicrobiales bacterium]|nr:MFS transporter [Acidimicrobiales bacterium]MDP6900547.1 MFS transporter [Acidimicrobiales bacterium]HJL98678.1 MFS transporter [Acidimicrobiales bacterium]
MEEGQHSSNAASGLSEGVASDNEPPSRRAPLGPFARLARVQLVSAAGDALFTIALAGSLFFNLDPDAARPKVALYLILTIAPFAIVGPLIGPLIDRLRGGRRAMVIVSGMGRAVLAFLMIRHLDSLLLFPEAFGALVLGKTYHVAKSAIVPGLVRGHEDLVEANSKLVLLSGVGGALAAGPGLLLGLIGSKWVLGAAMIAFCTVVPFAARLPKTSIARDPIPEDERSDLRSAGIVLAASAMAILRGMTGFTLFLVAFWLRREDAATIWFGLMVASSALGAFIGAIAAPLLRRLVKEEYLLGGVLTISAAVGFFATFPGDRMAVLAFVMSVGFAAGLGKLSFDAIVQRDAPTVNQGRSFARFETRFQLFWVLGALIPVIAPNGVLPLRAGLIILALSSGSAAFLYLGGLVALGRGKRTPSRVIADQVWTEKRYQRLSSRLPRWVARIIPDPSRREKPQS